MERETAQIEKSMTTEISLPVKKKSLHIGSHEAGLGFKCMELLLLTMYLTLVFGLLGFGLLPYNLTNRAGTGRTLSGFGSGRVLPKTSISYLGRIGFSGTHSRPT